MKGPERYDLIYDDSGHGPHIADKLKTCQSCRYCARYYPEIFECLMHCIKKEAMLEGMLGVCDEWKQTTKD